MSLTLHKEKKAQNVKGNMCITKDLLDYFCITILWSESRVCASSRFLIEDLCDLREEALPESVCVDPKAFAQLSRAVVSYSTT